MLPWCVAFMPLREPVEGFGGRLCPVGACGVREPWQRVIAEQCDGRGLLSGSRVVGCRPEPGPRFTDASLTLSLGISGANMHDSLGLKPLARGISPVRSRRGPRRRRPVKLHAGKGHNYDHLRRWLSKRGIRHRIAVRRLDLVTTCAEGRTPARGAALNRYLYPMCSRPAPCDHPPHRPAGSLPAVVGTERWQRTHKPSPTPKETVSKTVSYVGLGRWAWLWGGVHGVGLFRTGCGRSRSR